MNFEKVSDYLDSLYSRYGIPCTDCIVTKEHEVVFRHMTGYSDYEQTQKLNRNALFRLFSGTKVITMIAVLQLVEQGKLGLYDELTEYLPEFGVLKVADYFKPGHPTHWPEKGDPCHLARHSIRIIDLLTMTSGLNYNTNAAELIQIRKASGNQASTREVVRAMAKMLLVCEPGTHWVYDFGLDVAAAVVEVVSGMKFSEYLKRNVFEPLGISEFYFKRDPEIQARIPAMYMGVFGTRAIRRDDGSLSDGFQVTRNYESGGAGLIASVEDYSVVLDALANNGVGKNGVRVLSHESISLLQTPYTTGVLQEDFEEAGKKGYSYGLGVRVLTDPSASKSAVGEFGWDGAAGAYVLADPENCVSILYVQQIVGFPLAYSEIHPVIRDLVYSALEDS